MEESQRLIVGPSRVGLNRNAKACQTEVNQKPGQAIPSRLDALSYCATCIAGGCQVPEPGGRMEGGSVFGQYRRITR